MHVQLISLALVLAVLAGCPDTPPEEPVDAVQERGELAIKKLTDADAAARTRSLESAKRLDHYYPGL